MQIQKENGRVLKGYSKSTRREPISSSITPCSSATPLEGFKNGGNENKLSKCASFSLQRPRGSILFSALPPLKPLTTLPKIPEAVASFDSGSETAIRLPERIIL